MPSQFKEKKSEKLQGVILLRGVLGDAVSDLGARIVGGEWQPGSAIPTEAELCDLLGVGRSVVREAFRVLTAKGLIRSRTSDGTRVLPRSEWRLLDPDIIQWRIVAGDNLNLLDDLLKVRLVLEPGMVFVATEQADEAARARVKQAWEGKVEVFGSQEDDYEARREKFIDMDLRFHRALLEVVESELLSQLFTVIESALRLLLDLQMRARGYETEMIGMDESQEMHRKVFEAFYSGDSARAEVAMRELIHRAILDAKEGIEQLEQR